MASDRITLVFQPSIDEHRKLIEAIYAHRSKTGVTPQKGQSSRKGITAAARSLFLELYAAAQNKPSQPEPVVVTERVLQDNLTKLYDALADNLTSALVEVLVERLTPMLLSGGAIGNSVPVTPESIRHEVVSAVQSVALKSIANQQEEF